MNNKPEGYSSRSDKRKDKRINRTYNVLITIVIILIVAVGATIFMGGDDQEVSKSPKNQETATTEQSKPSDQKNEKSPTESEKAKEDDSTDKEEASTEDKDKSKEEDKSKEKDKSKEEDKKKPSESKIVEEAPADSNVKKAYSNTAWQAVGTSQQGEHVTQFNQGSTDWKEMERALAYGAGINEKEMTTWFLENGGAPDKAIGTISPKDDSQTYRVYIQWVDGEGWKPTKVEELVRNDKR